MKGRGQNLSLSAVPQLVTRHMSHVTFHWPEEGADNLNRFSEAGW